MADTKKAVVLLRGGLDSTTILALAKVEGFKPYALSFNYGQRYKVELEAASFFPLKPSAEPLKSSRCRSI